MALTPYSGSTPQRNVRATFSTYMDAWLTWFLDTFMTEIDTVITAMNFNSTNSTSSTSDTIATGSTTITVTVSKSYVVGMTVKIAYTTDATNWMAGEVTAYDSGTGSLTVNVRVINGSGTYAAWTISLSVIDNVSLIDSHIIVHSGNGHGSTNTKIRRFTTALTSTGSDITYADNATLGGTFTINADGIYSIFYHDKYLSGGNFYVGLSLNSAELTTSIQTSAVADRIGYNFNGGAPLVSVTKRFSSGDVIRAHTDGLSNATDTNCYLSIQKVANV